jgi:hypothetical protein
MDKMKRNVLIRALLALAIGLGVGLAVGWVLWPVEYTNTTPEYLRQDFMNDYVMMVAATYSIDHDLVQAAHRLDSITPGEPERPAVELALSMIQTNGERADIERLARLARDLGAVDETLAPYWGDTP